MNGLNLMIIHWGYLLAGVFVALFPGKYLRGSEYRHFEYDQLSRRLADKNKRRRRWWKMPAVWIEPLRGFAAAFLLSQALSLEPETVDKTAKFLVMVLPLLILTVGVTIQCTSDQDRIKMVTPIGYLSGLIIGLLPLTIALPAVVLGASSAIAFRRWAAGHLLGGVAAAVIGYFFLGPHINVAWAAGICVWPVVLAWFYRRKLVIVVRM